MTGAPRTTLRSVQQSLTGPTQTAVNGRKLSRDQEVAWILTQRPGGVSAEYVGAVLHALKETHSVLDPCIYCEERGRQVLRSKALRRLVIHRRSLGVWMPRDKTVRGSLGVTAGTTSQLADLDGLFGDAA